jgi:hypothetical protein
LLVKTKSSANPKPQKQKKLPTVQKWVSNHTVAAFDASSSIAPHQKER